MVFRFAESLDLIADFICFCYDSPIERKGASYMETKSSSHSRPLRPSYVHPDTASVNRKLDMVESLFGSVPASATLEEARDERLNGSCINRDLHNS